ncbi:hypothetical protein J6590_024578 [Homalodisca vitripennis]|nr:hypothetical protein J6590_024578 [Homalodisca vitripennis]
MYSAVCINKAKSPRGAAASHMCLCPVFLLVCESDVSSCVSQRNWFVSAVFWHYRTGRCASVAA